MFRFKIIFSINKLDRKKEKILQKYFVYSEVYNATKWNNSHSCCVAEHVPEQFLSVYSIFEQNDRGGILEYIKIHDKIV